MKTDKFFFESYFLSVSQSIEISESFKNWTRNVLGDSQIPIFDYYSENYTKNATENQLLCALSNFLCKNSGLISQSRSGGNFINTRIRSSNGYIFKKIFYTNIYLVLECISEPIKISILIDQNLKNDKKDKLTISPVNKFSAKMPKNY